MLSDYHVHTSFSTNCHADMEAVVKKAIELGMPGICITDHYDMDYPTGEFQLDIDRYIAEVTRVREKYAGQIEVLLGLDMGLQPQLGGKSVQLYPLLSVRLCDRHRSPDRRQGSVFP